MKAEDFKPRKSWQTINDCRMLVRAVDMFIQEGMLHKAETLLADIQSELIEWDYFSILNEFYRRLLPLVFRIRLSASANKTSLLNILRNYAALNSAAGDHSASADAYTALWLAARRFKEKSALLLATGKLTEELRESGNHKRAISVAKRHLKHAIDSSNPVIIAAAHGRLGHAYLEAGEGRRAEEQYYNALELFRDNGHRKGEAAIVGYLAKLYSKAGYYEDAISLLVRRLEITGEIDDEGGRCETLSDLSKVHLQVGEDQKAITVLEQLVASSESAGNLKTACDGLSAIARIAFASGDFAQAIMRQSERLAIAEKMKDDWMAGNALGHIGHAYNRMMDRGKAIEHYARAEQKFSSDGYLAGMAKCRHYIARLHGAEKQWDKALQNILQSIDLKLLSGDDNISYDLKVLSLCRYYLEEDEYNMLAARETGEDRLTEIESMSVE
jgi:tetratricopeptide (TPR) repeat protein